MSTKYVYFFGAGKAEGRAEKARQDAEAELARAKGPDGSAAPEGSAVSSAAEPAKA